MVCAYFVFKAHFIGCLTYQSSAQKTNDASGVALKSVPWLSAKPTGIVCHDVETSRQRALGLEVGVLRASGVM